MKRLNGLQAGISALAIVLAVLLTACGGDPAAPVQDVATSSPSDQDIATSMLAAQNQPNLKLTDDLALTEVLDGRTGAITNLAEVVTGDRAVVLWYWTPN